MTRKDNAGTYILSLMCRWCLTPSAPRMTSGTVNRNRNTTRMHYGRIRARRAETAATHVEFMKLGQSKLRGFFNVQLFLRNRRHMKLQDNGKRTRLSRKEGKTHNTGRKPTVNKRLPIPPVKTVNASHCVPRSVPSQRPMRVHRPCRHPAV